MSFDELMLGTLVSILLWLLGDTLASAIESLHVAS